MYGRKGIHWIFLNGAGMMMKKKDALKKQLILSEKMDLKTAKYNVKNKWTFLAFFKKNQTLFSSTCYQLVSN